MRIVRTLAGRFYLIALSLWVGGMALFTFIMTPVIFASYSRDAAAGIVGALFPFYFVFTLLVVLLALCCYILATAAGERKSVVLGLIVCALIITLYTNFRVYPEIKKVRQQVSSFETTPSDAPERVRFRRLHARSALLNLALMTDGLIVLISSAGLKRRERGE